jgi:hypothetical protein
MVDFQKWLVTTLASVTPIGDFMRTQWGWPAAESLHFIGLSLLVGGVFLFDLRLLGMGKRIPIRVVHRLIPWGLLGYVITALSGMLFMMTEPDQYIYNPSFHFKMLFMVAAGFNAAMFYLISFRRTIVLGPSVDAPRAAKTMAAISIVLWISVIVAGRLITFYRPWPCGPEGPGFLAECIPDYHR